MAESEKTWKIIDLAPCMQRICCKFIVLEVNNGITTKDGHVITTCRVADRTASINLSVWDEKGKAIKSGDILKLNKGYANVWKNVLTLYTGKAGQLTRVGEFSFLYSELPFLSEPGRFTKPPGNDTLERMPSQDLSIPYPKLGPDPSEMVFTSPSEQNGHPTTPDMNLIPSYLPNDWRLHANIHFMNQNSFAPMPIHPMVTPPHLSLKQFPNPTPSKQSNGTSENEKQVKKN